jgi:hypothetical protein
MFASMTLRSASTQAGSDGRRVYRDGQSDEKRHINEHLLPRMLAETPDAGFGAVLVLDGPDMRTSKALVRHAGILARRIHVIESSPAALADMRALVLRGKRLPTRRAVARGQACKPAGRRGMAWLERGRAGTNGVLVYAPGSLLACSRTAVHG